jgi:hypothetical protein
MGGNMTILDKNGEEIKIQLKSGEITRISLDDEDLVTIFPTWVMCGSVSKYVNIQRQLSNEFGAVTQKIYLHVAIMYKIFGKEKMRMWKVDHKDRDKLNNRRDNLRLASNRENMANRVCFKKSNTGYKGVTQVSRSLKKRYNLSFAGKNWGYFDNPIDAAKEYDKKAKERFGEFAMLNFPENQS